VQNRCALVVTPFIFAESQAFFCRVPELRELIIRDFWANALVHFEQPTFQDQMKAVEILKQQRDKSYSFADAISFVVMTRLHIEEVATYDSHFKQFGQFNVIDGSDL
jgi:predicted nucleic acid-binding protein